MIVGLFVTVPLGDGEVSININEIASFYSHRVSTYSYEDRTMVILKNGMQHDCRIKKRDFEAQCVKVTEKAVESGGKPGWVS